MLYQKKIYLKLEGVWRKLRPLTSFPNALCTISACCTRLVCFIFLFFAFSWKDHNQYRAAQKMKKKLQTNYIKSWITFWRRSSILIGPKSIFWTSKCAEILLPTRQYSYLIEQPSNKKQSSDWSKITDCEQSSTLENKMKRSHWFKFTDYEPASTLENKMKRSDWSKIADCEQASALKKWNPCVDKLKQCDYAAHCGHLY